MKISTILLSVVLLASGLTAANAQEMYWTDSSAGKILKAGLDGTGVEDVLVNPVERPRGIVFDLAGGKMYWTDADASKIQRANLDGTAVEDLVVSSSFFAPSSLALDLSAGKLYWGEGAAIRRADLDGTNIQEIVAGTFHAQGLALDVAGGKIYWHAADTIRRAELDGTNAEVLYTTGAFTQTPVALDVAGGKLYWAARFIGGVPGKIQRANLDGSGVEDLVTIGSFPPTPRVTLDVAAGKMYWIEPQAERIRRANLDGTGVEDLVAIVATQPQGVVLDPGSGKMYWTEVNAGRILRADLAGTNVEELVGGLTTPGEVALDEAAGTIYWTSPGKIQRASVDGTGVEELLLRVFVAPGGLAIDRIHHKMYWADPATDKIQRANLDGTELEFIVTTGLEAPRDVALDVTAGKIYWADSGTDKIQRANLDGTQVEDLVTVGLDGPETLAFDTAHGKIYWTEQSRWIRRADLDGTGVEDLVNLVSFPLRGIAIDVVAGKLYWAIETSSPPISSGLIQRADLNGWNVENVVSTGGGVAADVALDLTHRKIYWARGGGEFTPPALHRSALDGSSAELLVANGFPQSVALDVPLDPLPATGFLFGDPASGLDSFASVFETIPEAAAVGPVGSDNGFLKDVAVDPLTGLVYTIDADTGAQGQQLYVIDPQTGVGTPLPGRTGVPAPGLIWGLAFDDDGTLYGGGLGVYTIDKSSGQASLLADLSTVPAYIFGMADYPGGDGFLSTGVILIPELTVPYVALHAADGAFVPGGVFLAVDPTGEGRVLFDIGVSANGSLYGNAWPASLFESNGRARTRARHKPIEKTLAELRSLHPAQLHTEARSRVAAMRQTMRVPESANAAAVASELVVIDIVDTFALMSPGAPLNGLLVGLGGTRVTAAGAAESERAAAGARRPSPVAVSRRE